MQPCSDAVISVGQKVSRDLMEAMYRLIHCLSPDFSRSFNWSTFVAGLESGDLIMKWLVDVCLLS